MRCIAILILISIACVLFPEDLKNKPSPLVGISEVSGGGPYKVTFQLTYWNEENSAANYDNLAHDGTDPFDSVIWDSLQVYDGAALIHTFTYNAGTKLGDVEWTTALAAGDYKFSYVHTMNLMRDMIPHSWSSRWTADWSIITAAR